MAIVALNLVVLCYFCPAKYQCLQLNLPPFEPELSRIDDKTKIKCLVRKKWLVLTPEEWVRQHFLNYLFTQQQVSRNRTAVEFGLEYNGLKKRIDILVFDTNGNPNIMVECKAPHIVLNAQVIRQIATYNSKFMVPELCVTNGMKHFWFGLQNGVYQQLKKH
ncbi:restriction endonuclease subunit R [bacterium]|nr:restriction endonuclease subunit R [bacterium]